MPLKGSGGEPPLLALLFDQSLCCVDVRNGCQLKFSLVLFNFVANGLRY